MEFYAECYLLNSKGDGDCNNIRVLAFIISGVIHGVGGFLGRVFVLTGACLAKIELRTESYC